MTQANWKRPLILASILFVLSSAAYWLEFKHAPEVAEKEAATKKIFDLKETPSASVRLVDGSKDFVFKCLDTGPKACRPSDASKWQVESPSKLKADDANVNSFLSTLNSLSVSETVELKEETPEKRASLLKQYGLDAEALKKPGMRRMEVTDPKGQATVLYLGETHPIGQSIFGVASRAGKVEETRVYLIPSFLKSNFDHDLTYWRDKKIFTIAAREIKSFEVKTPKNDIAAEKKDGDWNLRVKAGGKSEDMAADNENVENLLSAVITMNARDFASEQKSDEKARAMLKGAKQELTFTLQPEAKGSAPVVFTILSKTTSAKPPSTQLYATVSNLDPLFTLDSGARNRLDKEPKDLRLTRLITSMERFTTKRIEFNGHAMGGKPLVLEDSGGKWVIGPEKTEADKEKVQTFMDKISGNRIKEFLRGTAVPAGEKDGLTLVLGDEKNPKKRQLTFWKSGDKLYARDSQSARDAFLVDASVKDALPPDRAWFNKAAPAPAAPPKKTGT